MSGFNDDAMSLHSLVVQDALDRQSELVDVRADGYQAAQKGQQASDCPHHRLSAEHSAWMAGFDAGLGVLREHAFCQAGEEFIRELFAACTCDGVNECEKCKKLREQTK